MDNMTDPIIKRVRRLIDESRNRGGMRAGMPKVAMDAADAERLCVLAESALSAPRAPDEMTEYKGYVPPEDGSAAEYYIDGWNDCRDEMLTTAPPTPDPDELTRLWERVAELEAFRSTVVGWRESDWPAAFCRATAETIAQHGDANLAREAARLREGSN